MVHVVFRTSPLATGRGVLSIDWTDVHGRVVDHRSLPVELIDETDAGFDIDLRRARGMQNELRAHLIFDGQDKKGRPDHRDEEASRPFIAKPPDALVVGLRDHHVAAIQRRAVRESCRRWELMADNTSDATARPPEFLLKNDLRWYAENIATDFFSAYHRYFPDRDNGWFFQQARLAHQRRAFEPGALQTPSES